MLCILSAAAGCCLLVAAGFVLEPFLGLLVAGIILVAVPFIVQALFEAAETDIPVSVPISGTPPATDRDRLAAGYDLPPAQVIVGRRDHPAGVPLNTGRRRA